MIARWPILLSLLALALASTPGRVAAEEPRSPEAFLGHKVGADFKLASWKQITGYFEQLGKESDRVNVRQIGTSSGGRPFLVAEITSADNLKRRAEIIEDTRKVVDPRRIVDASDEARLLRDAKVVIGVACSLHATEVMAAQMSMELAHGLATASDPDTLEILDRAVILLFPSQNPDGLDMVRDWYLESLGTPWEGGRLPWLYQKYAGHDNNRDWFMLNLKETRLVTQVLYRDWGPTIYYDVHQMGNRGARFFVPPFHDPINPNLHPLINQFLMIIGGHMSADLAAAGKRGVVTGAIFDNWWAGGNRTTPQRHNIVALLTEAASANIASPVFQRKRDLSGGGRGMPSYEPTVNFADPWPGGWWRARDVVDYELVACRSLFTLAARYRDRFVRNQIALGREQLELGRRGAPYAWLVPERQRDPKSAAAMLEILHATGIEVHLASAPFTADGSEYPAGTRILYAAQPFRPHLKDMMERQVYPTRESYPGGPPETPYDMAGWTLPIQMGVDATTVTSSFQAEAELLSTVSLPRGTLQKSDDLAAPVWLLSRNQRNDDFVLISRLQREGIPVFVTRKPLEAGGQTFPAGSILTPGEGAAEGPRVTRRLLGELLERCAVELHGLAERPDAAWSRLTVPRIGLYQPWTASMDEGWTRLVLERFEIPYVTLHDTDIRRGGDRLRAAVDVVLLPSISARSLESGAPKDSIPPQYAGGLGVEGIEALQAFCEGGGTLVASDASTNLVIDRFQLPIVSETRGKEKSAFYGPGSILRVTVDPTHPLGYGMPARAPAFFQRSQAFTVQPEALGAGDKKGGEDALVPGVRELDPAIRYPTVAPYHYADTLLLQSGFMHHPEVIAGKAAVTETKYGKGRVVLLGFRTQHRGQPHATFRVLFNALLRPGLAPASPPK